MKIKEKLEDFIVKEIADLPLTHDGTYRVYKLEKRNHNTLDVLLKISKRFRIPLTHLAYGGKKDRHAITSQFITVKNRTLPKIIEDEGYTLTYIGNSTRPMGPDLIKGNEFKVCVRDIENNELENAIRELEIVKTQGFINYFDDQRFGSYSPQQGFIAEKILKKHYNGALKIYLTAIYHGGGEDEIKRRKFFYKHWGKWDECLKKAKTSFEKNTFGLLKEKKKKGYLEALKLIPAEEMAMFFSAFQSYLWNKVAEELVILFAREIISFKGLYWEYLFYRESRDPEYMKNLVIPTASYKTKMPDALTQEIYAKILNRLNLRESNFNLKKIRTAYFKSHFRKLVVVPEIKEVKVENDELNPGRKKLILTFYLPRGSYGTMFIKRLFARKKS